MSEALVVEDLKMRLLGSQIQPFLSSYLMNGFRLDSFQIESVDVSGAAIVAPDPAMFYTGGRHGYIDYPALAA